MNQSNLFIEKLYQELEMELLINIGKRIKLDEEITPEGYVNWQVQKLSQMPELSKQQMAIIARYAEKTGREVEVYIDALAKQAVSEFEGSLPDEIEKIDFSDTMYSRLIGLEQQAKDLFNMVNSTLIASSQQVYKDIITQGVASMLTGNTSFYQAAKRVASGYAKQGMPVLIDRANRRWSVEGYIPMVLRSTNANVANKMQEEISREYDVDLVEVSSHPGCRPSHFLFQGKIYSRSGTSDKYPPLSDTGYGTPGGLRGVNCGHMLYAYVEGLSTKRPPQQTKEQSDKEYAESQKQRQLERNIRAEKKNLEMLKAMNAKQEDIKLAEKAVRDRQANMREFISDTGRFRRSNREQIYKLR